MSRGRSDRAVRRSTTKVYERHLRAYPRVGSPEAGNRSISGGELVVNVWFHDPDTHQTLSGEADAQEVDHVLQVPAHEGESTVAVVSPADPRLFDREAELFREAEDLDVAHVAIDPGPTEDLFGTFMREELEAAL